MASSSTVGSGVFSAGLEVSFGSGRIKVYQKPSAREISCLGEKSLYYGSSRGLGKTLEKGNLIEVVVKQYHYET